MTSQTENSSTTPASELESAPRSFGLVCLVGAGPGDPGLITVKGLERLKAADAVVYDALANPQLLEHVHPDAQLIDAGKRSRQHKLTQDQTQELLVKLASQYALVVRLKGGDPYLFGRGAEEAAYLARHGVKCEVIPGVTAGIAAPAMAGVPVTHRAIASTVTFVTGHEDPTKEDTAIDYLALAQLAGKGGTLCFYMGVGRLRLISQSLIDAGLNASTPVAVVQWGTHPKQKSIRSTLAQARDAVEAAKIGPPALIVVGQVAGMDEPGLDYFTTRPLFGKRVIVTRTRQQVSELRLLLEEAGAMVIEAPTIDLVPPANWDKVDQAIRDIQQYDWLVLTSVNAVATLADRLTALSLDARHLAGVKLAVIGQPTAEALRQQTGIVADISPQRFVGESLAQSMIALGVEGKKILSLQADIARPALSEMLTKAGGIVTQVTAYETRLASGLPEEALQALSKKEVDWVTFTSASTARNLVELLGDQRDLLQGVKVASMGPVTSEAVRGLGLEVAAEPPISTLQELVKAMGTAG